MVERVELMRMIDRHGRSRLHIHDGGAHRYVRLLVHHSHGGKRHVRQDRVGRYAITWRAGERRRIQRVMPRVATAKYLAVRHVRETKSRVRRGVHDQNATAVHIKTWRTGLAFCGYFSTPAKKTSLCK